MSYYNSDNICLYHGDCLKILHEEIEDSSVDVIFADPPYFLSNGGFTCKSGKRSSVNKGSWDKSPENVHEFNKDWISLCQNKLTPNGTIWISGTFHNIFSVGLCLQELDFKVLNLVTWEKPNPPPNLSCRYFTHSTEQIIWAAKSSKSKYEFRYSLMKEENGNKQMKDVWRFTSPKKREKKFGKHPTQKPEALMERILRSSTREGFVVMDPFNGSGTTGVVCHKLGLKYIGIEREQEYLDLSIQKIEGIKNSRQVGN